MIYQKRKTNGVYPARNRLPKKVVNSNGGFIALISALIISAVLLLLATSLSFTGFYSRSDILDSELKEKSFALAEACVDTALLKLANDPDYKGIENVTIFDDTCAIDAINPTGDPIIISTKAVFQKATTNLSVRVNKIDLSVVSWEEKP